MSSRGASRSSFLPSSWGQQLSERWQQFAVYPDAASAEVAAGLLRSEGVPVNVASDEPMPGLIEGFRLMVPAEMLHRARWVVSNADFTEEELAFFATARLDSDGSAQES